MAILSGAAGAGPADPCLALLGTAWQEATRSTSGRRPAKRKWQDAMFRVKTGLPTPSRRTFATGILPCAHSMPAALTASCLRLPPTPARGHGQPPPELPQDCVAGCDAQHQRAEARQAKTGRRPVFRVQPLATRSTSGRRPAKRKWRDAMFRVKPGQPLPDASNPQHRSPTGRRERAHPVRAEQDCPTRSSRALPKAFRPAGSAPLAPPHGGLAKTGTACRARRGRLQRAAGPHR